MDGLIYAVCAWVVELIEAEVPRRQSAILRASTPIDRKPLRLQNAGPSHSAQSEEDAQVEAKENWDHFPCVKEGLVTVSILCVSISHLFLFLSYFPFSLFLRLQLAGPSHSAQSEEDPHWG